METTDGKRLTFNEFQRLLQQRSVDDRTAYVLTVLYEQVADMSTQLDETLKVINALAENMLAFSNLRIQDQHMIRSLIRRSRDDGVSVASVANEPEK